MNKVRYLRMLVLKFSRRNNKRYTKRWQVGIPYATALTFNFERGFGRKRIYRINDTQYIYMKI